MAENRNISQPEVPQDEPAVKRRKFLGWLLGGGTLTVAGLLSIPLIRFAIYPLTTRTTETIWSDLGPIEDFNSITVPVRKVITLTQIDGWRKVISEKTVYVVRDEAGTVKVLSAICPHLGCSIGWTETSTNFLCPCHKGVFTPAGQLVSGPPPRDMDELESRITEGRLQVHYQSFRQLVKTKEELA